MLAALDESALVKTSDKDANGNGKREIRVGISSCLLGEKVRFDGGHKRDNYINTTLSEFVRFVPVCPEVDIGLGTPRESIRLVRSEDGVRLVGPKSGADHTRAMERYSRAKAKQLGSEGLSGYILKKDSPTCGLFRVRVYDQNGSPSKIGRGLFAEALVARHPQLPVEEEGRLNDPRLRENFFERVFAYWRLENLFRARWRIGDLVRFHTAEKLHLMAHDPRGYSEVGRIVADAKSRDRHELADEYRTAFMGVMTKIATTRKHTNVLHHVVGHFKKLLTPDEKQELLGLIEDFHRGLVPLVAPITLIRHHIRRHEVEYLAGQSYLEPHPKELMLRNHV